MDVNKTGEKGLESLQLWQRSLEFSVIVCKHIIPLLPQEEKWALSSQLRRAVQSIPANIAESYGRYHYQDAIRFCYIARGSLEETFSQLMLAIKLGYLGEVQKDSLVGEIIELRKMLNGYISFLKRSKRGATEPGASGIEISAEDIRDYKIPEE
jgi:four helix bundle protein